MLTEPLVIGRKMTASCIVNRPSSFVGPFVYNRVFLMANYGSSANGWVKSNKTIKFHRIQFYPLTVTDASTFQHTTAIADLEGNASATTVMGVKAGTFGAELELVAASDPLGGGVSVARLRAGNILLDGTVAAEQMSVGMASNLIPSPDWSNGDLHTTQLSTGGIGAETVFNRRAPQAEGGSWSGVHYPTWQLYQNGVSTDGYRIVRFRPVWKSGGDNAYGVPVTPNLRYEFQIRLAIINCNAQIQLVYRDKNGVWITSTTNTITSGTATSSTDPNLWDLHYVRGNAPANTAYIECRVSTSGGTTSGSKSYIIMHHPMLSVVGPNVTEVANYDEGRSTFITGDGIVTGSITAGIGIFSDGIKSDDYVAGSSGYKLTSSTLEVHNLIVRESIINGAVSDGATALKFPTAYAAVHGESLGSLSLGEWADRSDLWQIGVVLTYRDLGIRYGPWVGGGVQEAIKYSMRARVRLQMRVKIGGSWGSYFTLHEFTQSNSASTWETESVVVGQQGVYDEVQMRIYVTKVDVNIGYTSTQALANTYDYQTNVVDVAYTGKALVR